MQILVSFGSRTAPAILGLFARNSRAAVQLGDFLPGRLPKTPAGRVEITVMDEQGAGLAKSSFQMIMMSANPLERAFGRRT